MIPTIGDSPRKGQSVTDVTGRDGSPRPQSATAHRHSGADGLRLLGVVNRLLGGSLVRDVSRLILVCYPGLDMGAARQVDEQRLVCWCEHAGELRSEGYRVLAVSSRPAARQRPLALGLNAVAENTGLYVVSDPTACLAGIFALPLAAEPEEPVYEHSTLGICGGVSRLWHPVDLELDSELVSRWAGIQVSEQGSRQSTTQVPGVRSGGATV